jgi:nitroreductase
MSAPGPVTGSVDLAAFSALAAARRSSLRMRRDGAGELVDVDDALVDALVQVSVWAPNHKQNWPWRFCAFRGEGRSRLGATVAAAMETAGVDDDAKLAKARGKYLRAPVVLAVASAADPDPLRHAENRDAVSSAVQTLLLAATAAGVASFWSSCTPAAVDAVRTLCGFGPADEVLALVYLGWPDDSLVPVPVRPPAAVSVVAR